MTVDKLIAVLEKLIEAHLQLNEIAQGKREAIMGNDLDTLTKVMKAESKWIPIITELDRERAHLSEKLMLDSGLNSKTQLTLRQVIGFVINVEKKAQLTKLESKLKEQVDLLRKRNELNQQLLQQAIDFIKFSIELIVPQPDNNYIYRNPAEYSQDSQQAGIYNKKV